MRAPDGGADTIVPADDGAYADVFQAKHFRSQINWKQCEDSLGRALERFEPHRVTFAFPRDFTERQERTFRERLVNPHVPRAAIEVWTLSDIEDRLDRWPDIRTRYLGREHESQLAPIIRAIDQGGKRLETGADLVDRAQSLAAFAEEHDRDFTYATTLGGRDMVAPQWSTLPFISLTAIDETTSVRVDAWAREGADVPAAGFTFTDDEDGRAALETVRRELAAGREAVLQSGVMVTVPTSPRIIRETFAGNSVESPEVRIHANAELRVRVEVETDDDRQSWSFAVRPVPPLEHPGISFASLVGALFVEFNFRPLEAPVVRFSMIASASFDEDVETSLAALRFVDAFLNHRRIVMRCDSLFPGGVADGGFELAGEAERDALRFRRIVYEELRFIEERLGVDFKVPEFMDRDDLAAITTVANVLRTGEGTATFHGAEGVVEAHEVATLPDRLREERFIRQPATYTVLGQDLNLGMAEYDRPPLRITEIKPLGSKADSPAHVRLDPAGDDQMTFRLIDTG